MRATDRTYADGNAFRAEHRCNLGNRILRLGYSHTISDNLQSAVANLELWYVKNMLGRLPESHCRRWPKRLLCRPLSFS